MKILMIHKGRLPAPLYGGTERVVWALGKALVALGHEVEYLTGEGSLIPFAKYNIIDKTIPLEHQIGKNYDVVHFHHNPELAGEIPLPYLVTVHGNAVPGEKLDKNSVFISSDHSKRHGSQVFVYNGLSWEDYSKVDFQRHRKYFHFLGKAAWSVKNLKGAIDVIHQTHNEKLHVLGGSRFNFKMGFRLTLSTRVKFHGMVGGATKDRLLNGSKGLIFPVRWHEPFGLSIIESLYSGAPVFGTPYGSLPELVGNEFGFLTSDSKMLAASLSNAHEFRPEHCHQYAREEFSAERMAKAYLLLYERVLNGGSLHLQNPENKGLQSQVLLDWH